MLRRRLWQGMSASHARGSVSVLRAGSPVARRPLAGEVASASTGLAAAAAARRTRPPPDDRERTRASSATRPLSSTAPSHARRAASPAAGQRGLLSPTASGASGRHAVSSSPPTRDVSIYTSPAAEPRRPVASATQAPIEPRMPSATSSESRRASLAGDPRRPIIIVNAPSSSSVRPALTSSGSSLARTAMAAASRMGQPVRVYATGPASLASTFGSSGVPSAPHSASLLAQAYGTGSSHGSGHARRPSVTRVADVEPSPPPPARSASPSLSALMASTSLGSFEGQHARRPSQGRMASPATDSPATSSVSLQSTPAPGRISASPALPSPAYPQPYAPSVSAGTSFSPAALQGAYAAAMAQAQQAHSSSSHSSGPSSSRGAPPAAAASHATYGFGAAPSSLGKTVPAFAAMATAALPSATSSDRTSYRTLSSSSSSTSSAAAAAATASNRVASISNHFVSSSSSNGAMSGHSLTAAGASASVGPRSSARALHVATLRGTSPSSPSSASSSALSPSSLLSSPSASPVARTAASFGYDDGFSDQSETNDEEEDPPLAISERKPPPSSFRPPLPAPASSTKRMRALVGLANMGNTCFLASSLQCLLSTPGLLEYFAGSRWEADVNVRGGRTKGSLARAFAGLASRMVSAHDGAVERPALVKSAVSVVDSKFLGFGQHDSHEFTRVLLAALHDDVNRIQVRPPYVEIKDGPLDSDEVKADRWWANYTDRNDSVIVDCFAGQMQSTLVCQTCHRQSQAFDPFMDLSLPIPRTGGASQARTSSFFSSGGGNSGRCTLDDCFGEFLREELLSGHEQVYCRSCKAHRDQTKKLRIYRWPRVLVLHLKRFSFGGFSRAKLNTDVDFPLELDCTHMQLPEARKNAPAIYDLYGVSNHMGSSGGGHYTAHCKVSDSASAPFYTFNDSSVHPVATSSVRGPSAYVLFFRRRS